LRTRSKMIEEILKKNKFKVIVKPNSRKTEITGEENNAIRLNVAAPADKNKANIEIVRFFTKLLKKKVGIASGLTSKEKIIEAR